MLIVLLWSFLVVLIYMTTSTDGIEVGSSNRNYVNVATAMVNNVLDLYGILLIAG